MKLRENIHNVFAVFARDMKRLLRNPIALVIVLGVCIMPSLYAWYTIEAQWDPYQNTEAIKVGVVNLDEGADSAEAGHLAIGEEVVAQLKDDHQLGWQFVDEQEGIQRVESGEYYACIVIPKNFSADFASIATGTFTKPELEYYVNEKLSGAAPKITDAGATALESKVNHSFISTVTDVVMGTMQKVAPRCSRRPPGPKPAFPAIWKRRATPLPPPMKPSKGSSLPSTRGRKRCGPPRRRFPRWRANCRR